MTTKLFRTTFIASLASIGTLGLVDARAADATASTPVQASGAISPFTAGCNGAPQSGINYPNSEVEPWVAVNPTDSTNIVGAWQQDR
jgi:hypothetical protein